jgi:translation elongation factor EF-1alpha
MVCVIGDVASGKSTLLRTIIGDTIFVPEQLIKEYRTRPGDSLEEFSNKVFSHKIEHSPVCTQGSMSYVE